MFWYDFFCLFSCFFILILPSILTIQFSKKYRQSPTKLKKSSLTAKEQKQDSELTIFFKKLQISINQFFNTKKAYLNLRILSLMLFIYIISYLNFSILWIYFISFCICLSIYNQYKSFYIFENIKFQQRLYNPHFLQFYCKLHNLELSSWINFPNFEKAQYLQNIVNKLWPYLKKATEDILNQTLPPILKASTPNFLSSLGLHKLDLGNVAPDINGCKLISNDTNEVVLDIDFVFAGVPEIVIGASTGPVTVYATLANFQLRSIARLVLKPLTSSSWPCFSCISFSFCTKPEIHFELQTANLNVMSLPKFNSFVFDLVKNSLAGTLVWPRKIVIPILPDVDASIIRGLQASEPQGILEIELCSLRDIVKADDVYITLTIAENKMKSSIIKQIKQQYQFPSKSEIFSFTIIDSNSHLQVQLRTKDNLLKLKQTGVIGKVSIPLESIIHKDKNNQTLDNAIQKAKDENYHLPLTNSKGTKAGILHLKICWNQFKKTPALSRQSTFDKMKKAIAESNNNLNEQNSTNSVNVSPLNLQQQNQTNVHLSNFDNTNSPYSNSQLSIGHQNNLNTSFDDLNDSVRGLLLFTIHSALNLYSTQKQENDIDAYCIIKIINKNNIQNSITNQQFKTNTVMNTNTPIFNSDFELHVQDSLTDMVEIMVMDKNRFQKDLIIGQLMIPIQEIRKNSPKSQIKIPLTNTQKGELICSYTFKEI